MRHKLDLFSYLSARLSLCSLASLSIFLFTATLSTIASAERNTLHNSLTMDGFIKLDVFRFYFNDIFIWGDQNLTFNDNRAMYVRDGMVNFTANSANWSINFGINRTNDNVWYTSKDKVDYVITYSGFSKFDIRLGIMRPFYGLEASQSSVNSTFIEDSIAGQMFALDSRAAATIVGGANNFGGGASIFLTDKNYYTNFNHAWQYGFSTRGFYNNVQPNKVWSIGLSFYYEDSARNTKVGFPLTSVMSLVNYSHKANNYASVGGVFAAGNKSAQAEIFYNIAKSDVTSLLGSAQAAWVVTGEAREFDARTGTLGSIAAANDSYGAVEIAFRVDYLYVSGGDNNKYALTLGTNWYANSNVKLQANLIMANIESQMYGPSDNQYVVGAGIRAQVSF